MSDRSHRADARVGARLAPFAALAATLFATPLAAQPLAPKRVLTLPAASQCTGAALPPSARRDAAGARAEAARARELALVGERAAARDAFVRAAALDPADPQLAYDLARAAEEAGDRATAASALCRYLVLAPSGREVAEVRARLSRVAASTANPADESVRATFQRGVDALEARRYEAAVTAFDEVLRTVPSAPEATYDRGLARLALGQDAAAASDLAAYVASPAAGPDRAQVLRAVEALRQPRWSVAGALGRGLVVPGFGQFYTGRPIPGLAVLAGTAGGIGLALFERRTIEQVTFLDTLTNTPYTNDIPRVEHPYRAAGLATAGILAIAGAAEAAYYAAVHSRERPRLQLRTAAAWVPDRTGTPLPAAVAGFSVAF
ncbi:tetratricopeptide repeat protein [Roseisolibacter agri]|nr:tetratricopeptide repeat protein [Roseisolibacter agri]